MLYFPTKIYKTKKKIEPIFFSYPEKIKLVIGMLSEEFQNDIYKGNIQKSCEIFNLNLDTEFKIIGINDFEAFNWQGLSDIPNLKLAFFGNEIKPFPTLPLNIPITFNQHSLFVTYTMAEIVKNDIKKGEFWNAFKEFILE